MKTELPESIINLAKRLNATVQVRDIPIDLISASSFNPLGRTNNVKALVESLREFGQLESVHAVDFDGRLVVADGTRRLASAPEAGLKTLRTAVYTPKGGVETATALLERLYVELNQPRQTLKNGQMLSTALQGGPTFNSAVKLSLSILSRIFTAAELEMLNSKGITPTTLQAARKSTHYVLREAVAEATPTFQARLRKHVLYLVRNSAKQAVSIYMRLKYDPEALKNAIDNNRPVPRVSSEKMKEKWVK